MQNQVQLALSQDVIEYLMDGILILSEQGNLIYANNCAYKFLLQLNQGKTPADAVPQEIWHLCQFLIDSRHLFPNQYWLIESEVFTENSISFHLRVQWLQLDPGETSCLLVIVKDQNQFLKNIALEEAQKYGLTCRETDVWLLSRSNYTYKQIATQLQITLNTVKKHMKSIYVKQKAVVDHQP